MRKSRFTAEQIKKARAALGLTQAEMATDLGVSQGTISAWEQKRASPGTIAGQEAVERFIKEAEQAV